MRLRQRFLAPLQEPARIDLSSGLVGEQGFSLVEVLVALALVGLLSALAVLNFNRSGLNLADATETLAGNIRLARANAVSRGARYRVTLHSNSYSLQRLQR